MKASISIEYRHTVGSLIKKAVFAQNIEVSDKSELMAEIEKLLSMPMDFDEKIKIEIKPL